MKCWRVPSRRCSIPPQIAVAPAARAALTTASIRSGRSDSPGRIGAIPTLALMPAATSFSMARSRCCGGAVPGSVLRQTSMSRVGMLNVTPKIVENELHRGKRALVQKLGPYLTELGVQGE